MSLAICSAACAERPDAQANAAGGQPPETAADTPAQSPSEPAEHPIPVAIPQPGKLPRSHGASRQVLRFTVVEPGLEFIDTTVQLQDGKPLRLSVVRVMPNRLSVRLAATPDPSQGGLSLTDFERKHQARAVLSGGFLKSFYPAVPLGFIKVGGETLNRWVDTPLLNGVVWLGPEGATITSALADKGVQRAADGLQTGPVLVSKGQVDARLKSVSERKADQLIRGSFERAFIGVDDHRRILLGRSGPVALSMLGRFLAAPAEQGGLALRDVVNLSGSRSAGLLVYPIKFSIGDDAVQLHNAFVVVQRGADR